MGRKVHPYGFRLKVIRDWKSNWFAEGEQYAELLHEDLAIRQLIHEQLAYHHHQLTLELRPGLILLTLRLKLRPSFSYTPSIKLLVTS